jgi:hypothetical protein
VPGFLYQWPLWLVGALMTAVLIGFAVASVLMVRRLLFRMLRFGSHFGEFGGAMLHSMMVFYGLVTALIAVNVYETYTDVDKIVSREATSLAALYRDVTEYPEPTRSQLQAAIASYVRQIIDEAWPIQRRGEVQAGGVALMDAFQRTLTGFEPASDGQRILHAETLRAYDHLIDARRLRLDAVDTRLPGILWSVVIVGAVISVSSSFLFRIEDARLQGIHVVLLSTFIGLVVFLIFALDRPFHGELGLGPDAYRLIYR